MRAGILALMVVLVALLLLPFLLADAMIGGLLALGLSPRIALLLVIGIFLGSMFNVPVWRRTTGARVIEYQQQALFGIERLVPRVLHADAQQVVALNVGGCLLPVADRRSTSWRAWSTPVLAAPRRSRWRWP
jgi:uncharacterized membrane protein